MLTPPASWPSPSRELRQGRPFSDQQQKKHQQISGHHQVLLRPLTEHCSPGCSRHSQPPLRSPRPSGPSLWRELPPRQPSSDLPRKLRQMLPDRQLPYWVQFSLNLLRQPQPSSVPLPSRAPRRQRRTWRWPQALVQAQERPVFGPGTHWHLLTRSQRLSLPSLSRAPRQALCSWRFQLRCSLKMHSRRLLRQLPAHQALPLRRHLDRTRRRGYHPAERLRFSPWRPSPSRAPQPGRRS